MKDYYDIHHDGLPRQISASVGPKWSYQCRYNVLCREEIAGFTGFVLRTPYSIRTRSVCTEYASPYGVL